MHCKPPQRALPKDAVLLGVQYQSMQSSSACITRALRRALPARALPEHAVRWRPSQVGFAFARGVRAPT
eukprot:11157078-Prorocentrum_lima.AAC.1